MPGDETIFATSSSTGGCRGILRLSGPRAWALGLAMDREVPGDTRAPIANRVQHVRLTGNVPAMLLLMKAPRSFTGEDVAELHLPGGGALCKMIEQAMAAAGARQALPGEFTARAFFNGKMDLTQAEGIAATIAAENARQLRAAENLRAGALHHWTQATAEMLASLLALVEAGIDFSDEEGVSFISAPELREKTAAIQKRIETLMKQAVRWEALEAMPSVVLVGKPNVGKSSLINALCGSSRAIVSPVAGTTRDALQAVMEVNGVKIKLIDAAGEEAGADAMQKRMNAARQRAMEQADLVVRVMAADCVDASPVVADGAASISILNKCDLLTDRQRPDALAALVSAKTGEGVDALRQFIGRKVLLHQTIGGEQITLNHRHRRHLDEAADALARACAYAGQDFVINFPELLAADLRLALNAIGEISGTISPDEILGRIFGTFCIGK